MFENKNYLVVGGTSGIGEAIVRKLAVTANVWVAARRSSDVSSVHSITLDVARDVIDVSTLPATLNGVVYCPGTINLKPFHRLTQEDFLQEFQVNVLGAVKVLQAVLPLLKASTDASVVLFSTVAVAQGMPFHASIASAKGAVEGLTRSLAAELAPRIRVNAVAPSLTRTPLSERLLSSEEKMKSAQDRHPLKKIGLPDDVAAAALFLLSAESSWMTGQVIGVDGGLSSIRS